MFYYKTPQKLRLYIVISMNYTIARINNRPCIRYYNIWGNFLYPIYSFTHYFDLSLYDTNAHYVFFKHIISVWKIHKTALHIINRIQNILQICQYLFFSHR